MPAVLAVLRSLGTKLWKKGLSFLGQKAASSFSSGINWLGAAFQRRKEEEETRASQLAALQALGFPGIKKRSFADRLFSDQPLLLSLVLIVGVLFFLLMAMLGAIIPASTLPTLTP